MSTPNTARAAKPAAKPAAKAAPKPAAKPAPARAVAAKPAARPAAKAAVKKVAAKAPAKKVAAKAPTKKTVAAKPVAKAAVKPAIDTTKLYKLLTGVDDGAFCQKVSDHIEAGYELYGSPSIVLKGGLVYAAQAVTRKPKASKKGKKK
jgi:hypothetical protein